MAGATNRAMKAAGVPKATISTLRVEHGGHLSLRSAISIAHERGLDTGKAHEFMAKRDAKKAAAPAAQAATADFRSKAAATMKAAGERTAKEGRAAVLAARLRDRAANALGTDRGDIANARADRILKANPGARGLAEQLRGERRFETKSAVNQTMRLGSVSRSNFNLPATRSERVAGLLGAMKARETQSADARTRARAAKAGSAPTAGGIAQQRQIRRGMRLGDNKNLVVTDASTKQVTVRYESQLADGGGSRFAGKNTYVYRWDGKGYKKGGEYLKLP